MPHRFLHPGQLGQRHRLGPGIEVERVIMGVSAARGLREGGTSRPWRLNSVTPIDAPQERTTEVLFGAQGVLVYRASRSRDTPVQSFILEIVDTK